jgi:hypothetical protein
MFTRASDIKLADQNYKFAIPPPPSVLMVWNLRYVGQVPKQSKTESGPSSSFLTSPACRPICLFVYASFLL